MAKSISWSAVMASAKVVLARSSKPTDEEINELICDFDEIVPIAKQQVEEFTGLLVPPGEVSFKVLSREEWLEANLDSYKHLISKATSKGNLDLTVPGSDVVSGAGLGVVMGWMATRVLGQYDLLLQNGRENGSGSLYFVAPNLIELERRFGFQKRQFRHWVALHELTHRAQFEGVPWFRCYFSSLVDEMLEIAQPSPTEMVEAFSKAARRLVAGEPLLDETGLAGIFMSDRQRIVMEKTTALMSIAEGHGDWVMDRAGRDVVPEAWQFSRTLSHRRSSSQGAAKIMQSLLGLEAKMNQYARGERFIEEVERKAPGSSRLVWTSPESIPTKEEFSDVSLWLNRMGALASSVM